MDVFEGSLLGPLAERRDGPPRAERNPWHLVRSLLLFCLLRAPAEALGQNAEGPLHFPAMVEGVTLSRAADRDIGFDNGPGTSALITRQTGAGLFWETSLQTAGARVVTDAAGAVHAAYSAYLADEPGQNPAYYGYCPSACTSEEQWAIATIGDGESRVERVQLAVDSSGRPRMILYAGIPEGGYRWQYAACDAGCTDGANWTITTLVDLEWIDVSIYDQSLRNFALDPQGRPRLIYFDQNPPDHVGTFYAFCDADCTMPANWDEILLTSTLFSKESLAFTQSGLPRFSASYYGDAGPVLFYAACEASCAEAANWYLVPLADGGFGGDQMQVLRLDSDDRPRLAFYQASLDGGGGEILYYLACDASCLDAGNWSGVGVGLAPGDGKSADLALDDQGRPRIVYQVTGGAGLGLGRCNEQCESANALWTHELAEPSSRLDAEWPILPPPGCAASAWVGGYRPTLALGRTGGVHVGYDAEHLGGGGSCNVDADFLTVRYVEAQPTGGTGAEAGASLSGGHLLSAAYPNPFNGSTTFMLTLARTQQVTLTIFDVSGRAVAVLHEGMLTAEEAHPFHLDSGSLPSGLYIARAVGENFSAAQRAVLVK